MAILASLATAVMIEFRGDINNFIEKGLDDMVLDYSTASNSSYIKNVDDIQSELKCCGSRSLDSWNVWKQKHQDSYPDSCCADHSAPCVKPYEETCVHVITQLFEQLALVITVSGVCTAIVLFVSSISSCLLSRAFANQRSPYIQPDHQYGRILV